MKTREQIYGQEAAGILRDVSMYRALTEMQLLKLYPHKESKIRNLLSYAGKVMCSRFAIYRTQSSWISRISSRPSAWSSIRCVKPLLENRPYSTLYPGKAVRSSADFFTFSSSS